MPTRHPSVARTRGAVILTLVLTLVAGVVGFASPASAAQTVIAKDSMQRSVSSGWGAAETGGTWAALSSSITSVAGGRGWIQSPASGRTSRVSLPVSVRDLTSTFAVTIPTLPAAGLGYFTSYGVRSASDSAYQIGVRVLTSGSVEATVEKRVGFQTTTFQRVTLPQKIASGGSLNVAFTVSGTDKVALQGTVWPVGSTQPTTPTLSYADSSSSRLSGSGAIEFSLYTAPDTKALPLGIDDLAVTTGESAATPAPAPSGTPTPTPTPTATTPPAAAATTTTVSGARRSAGAAAPGTKDFAVPAGAVIVATTGSDSAAGTVASPLRTLAAAISKVGNGGTIVMRGGAYHENVIIPPQKKITLQPYRAEAVWMEGTEAVGGWRASGGVWIKDNWTQSLDASPTYTKGAPDGTAPGWQFVNPSYPMASHPDQIWVGGKQLTQVGSRGEVAAGKFYVDDAGNQLVLGTDPGSGKVEVSTLTAALSVRSVGTTVQGIGIRRYATSVPAMGMVIVAADSVTLSDVTIANSSTTGLYTWSKKTTLTRVSLLGNGLLGMGAAHADGLKITQLLSTGNNSERFNRAPVSGAMKVHSSNGVSVTDSVFADNYGQGPWFDESNVNVVFTGNDSLRNTGNGFVFELSETGTVANNLIAGNGVDGIFIVNSGNVSIWNNTLVGNTRNININMNTRRSGNTTTPWITRNIVVSNNVLASPKGDCLICVDDFSRSLSGNQMIAQSNGNLYHRSSSSAPRVFAFYSLGTAGGSQSSPTLSDFVNKTGRDTQSRLVERSSTVSSSYRLVSSASAMQGTVSLPIPQNIASATGLPVNGRILGAVFP